MNADGNVLMDEVRRYLDAVELFRSEGLEPCWEPPRAGPGWSPVTGTHDAGVEGLRVVDAVSYPKEREEK